MSELASLGPLLLGLIWSLTPLSGVFLWLRVYCKFLRGRFLWWDDYLLIASWVRQQQYSTAILRSY
jgi:hypothetical protein